MTRLDWRKLHDLYLTTNIIGVITSRRMRWEGHVVRMEEKTNAYRVYVGEPEIRRAFEIRRGG